MAKLKDGFYKQTAEAIGSDLYVLLAGGGSKALSDFATSTGVVTALGTNGNYVTWTKNGTANNLTVPYATKSESLVGIYSLALPSNTFDTGAVKYYYNILLNTEGLFPHNNNANSILTVSKHQGSYLSQLGFSSDRRLYFRSANGDDINSLAWNTIAYVSEIPTKVSQLTNDSGFVTGGPYLPTAGGTLTGSIKINSSQFPAIVVNNTNASGVESGIRFEMNGSNLGYVGYHKSYGTYIWSSTAQRYICISDDGKGYLRSVSTAYELLHSGNYSSYALPLTGGTIKGTLKIYRDAAAINYCSSGGTSHGWLGFSEADVPRVWLSNGSTSYPLLHTGNYSGYLDGRYYTETEVNNLLSNYLPINGTAATASKLTSTKVFDFGASAATYCKVASINITRRFGGGSGLLKFYTNRTTSTETYFADSFEVFVHAYQQEALGQKPVLQFKSNNTGDAYDIIGILNYSSSGSTFDIYAYGKGRSYHGLYVTLVHGDITIAPGSYVSSLPAGTQVTPLPMGNAKLLNGFADSAFWKKTELTKLSQLTDDIVTGNYLPLAGGNMKNTAVITFTANGTLRQTTATTSNAASIVEWYKGTTKDANYTHPAQIGWHNTGDTDGAIYLVPYPTNTDPWTSSVGLYIGKNTLKWNNQGIIHSGNIGSQSVNYATSAGSADSATSASYSRNLLGRTTSGTDYSATDGNLVFAEWNTHSDNRWYLKAKGYETRVGYANNSDKLDGIDSTGFLRQVVVANNTTNDFNTFENMTLTGRVDPTTGASLVNAPWTGGGPAGGYGVLTYLFNSSGYGTQMAWGYSSNRIYIRNRYWGGSGVGATWRTSWDSLALTSDLKNPADYYWANVQISDKSNSSTSPTFATATAGQFIANNSSGPHFTGTSTAGNWAYLRLNNSSVIWDIATRTTSGSGGLWLSRYGGNDNGIFVSASSTPKVGINLSSPSDVLDVAGLIRSTANSRYLRLGPQNNSHAHYETNADISHWFNKMVEVNGVMRPYSNNSFTCGDSSHRWSNVYSTSGNFSGTVIANYLDLRGATNATMTYASTNPCIVFSENGGQCVKLLYTDYDSYRSPAGLKVIGDQGGEWFETDGVIYASGGYPVITSVLDGNGYPALLTPSGSSNWIRVSNSSSYGLLPNQSGGAGSGHGYLGTSSWYFKYAYIDQIYGYLNGSISGNSNYLTIHDVRDASRAPSYFPSYTISGWFNSTGTPSSSWYSGIHVKGWTNGYASWELCSYSSTGTSNDYDLYFRNGNSSWGSWKTILNSSNVATYALKNYGADNSRPNGSTFTLPGGANVVSTRSGAPSGNDIGIFYLSDDNAFICNSSDSAYLFATFDTDKTANFSSADNAAFVVLSDHAGVKSKGDLSVGGLINSTCNGLTLTIGSQNTSWCHYSTNAPCHWFNTQVEINGALTPHSSNTYSLGSSTKMWGDFYTYAGYISTTLSTALPTYNNAPLKFGKSYNNNDSSNYRYRPWFAGEDLVNSYGYGVTVSCGIYRNPGYSNGGFYIGCGWDDNANSVIWKFSRDGNFYAPGELHASHFYENSDINLKTNIQEILDSDNIPVIKEFDWKSDGTHSYGLIAQELEEQGYSELVSDSGSHKTVNYSAALSLIVGKLQNKIKELEAEIENLKLRA